jgi:hypothetical protein
MLWLLDTDSLGCRQPLLGRAGGACSTWNTSPAAGAHAGEVGVTLAEAACADSLSIARRTVCRAAFHVEQRNRPGGHTAARGKAGATITNHRSAANSRPTSPLPPNRRQLALRGLAASRGGRLVLTAGVEQGHHLDCGERHTTSQLRIRWCRLSGGRWTMRWTSSDAAGGCPLGHGRAWRAHHSRVSPEWSGGLPLAERAWPSSFSPRRRLYALFRART